jgi:copper(I)-binding protein
MRGLAALALAFALVACGNAADEAEAPAHPALQVQLTLTPTAQGGTSYVYGVVRNDGREADRLLSISSPMAERFDFLGTRYGADGKAEVFTAADGANVPAMGELALAPGGMHLRAMRATASLVEGERAPVTLSFERSGDLQVEAAIAPPS